MTVTDAPRRRCVSVFIPAYLQQNILRYGFGAEGTRWLADLPRHIAELEQEWGLRVGPAFDKDGAVSWVAPVELRDGSEAVLKITFPHDEARFEAHALRFLDGRGAVRLLRASDDGFSLLLERCRPGTDLWSLGEAEGNAVACQMLPRMWREPDPGAPFMSLSDYVAPWWDDLPRITARRGLRGGRRRCGGRAGPRTRRQPTAARAAPRRFPSRECPGGAAGALVGDRSQAAGGGSGLRSGPMAL